VPSAPLALPGWPRAFQASRPGRVTSTGPICCFCCYPSFFYTSPHRAELLLTRCPGGNPLNWESFPTGWGLFPNEHELVSMTQGCLASVPMSTKIGGMTGPHTTRPPVRFCPEGTCEKSPTLKRRVIVGCPFGTRRFCARSGCNSGLGQCPLLWGWRPAECGQHDPPSMLTAHGHWKSLRRARVEGRQSVSLAPRPYDEAVALARAWAWLKLCRKSVFSVTAFSINCGNRNSSELLITA